MERVTRRAKGLKGKIPEDCVGKHYLYKQRKHKVCSCTGCKTQRVVAYTKQQIAHYIKKGGLSGCLNGKDVLMQLGEGH